MRRSDGKSGLGHEERFLPPRLSAGCGFSEETFAGTRANGRDGRLQIFPPLPPERGGSILKIPGRRPWTVGPTMERTFAPDLGISGGRLTPVRRAGLSPL